MKSRTTIQIAAPIICISLLLLIVGVSGAWYVQRLQRQTSKVLNQNVASIRAAEELNLYLLQVRFELNQFLIEGKYHRIGHAKEIKPKINEWLSKASELANSSEEQESLAAIREGLMRLFAKLNQLSQSSDSPDLRKEVEFLVEEELSKNILPSATYYLNINEQKLEASNRENQEFADRLILALLLLGTCGAIAGLVTGYGVASTVSRSIVKLSLPLKDVAGQLNEVVGPVTMSANPEIEDLENALNTVSGEVASVIQQLQDRQSEVIRADQLAALGQLSAGLAHELRNPLMCMTVLVQSALTDQTRTLDESDLHVLNDEMQRLDRLLQEFLNFARPAKMEFSRIDLRKLAEQTADFLLAKATQVGIKIKVITPNAPVTVLADDKQLRQLILNLLLNSIDATSTQGTIELDLSIDPHDERYCLLIIRDEGNGLGPEALNRAFEPFFSTKNEGLGMGLVTCKRIAEAHQGELSIANGLEKGAIITVRLPIMTNGRVSVEEDRPELDNLITNGK